MGTNTTKKYFYLPALGASGQAELDLYNAGQQVADTQMPVFPQAYATGTGTSGDPWAGSCIEDALAACPTGGTIFLRAGYYQLAGQATITKPVTIIGEGIGRTIITTVDAHGFFATTINNITIKNLTINGNAQTDNTYKACIVFEFECQYNIVENVEVKNGGQFGINIHNNSYGLFRNVWAHDNYEDGLHPSANSPTGTDHDNIYDGIYVWNNSNGLDAGSDVPNYGNNNTFNNINAWDNSGAGIAITCNKGSTLSNSFASGNANGIYIWPAEDLKVSNCFATLNTSHGIRMHDSVNVSFVNVISKNNAGSGFYIVNTMGTKITNCQFYDDRGTAIQDYGIENGDTSTADTIGLTNCKLLPNQYGNIYNIAGTIITVDGVVNGHSAVAGDILYHNGTNWVRLAKGTANQYLKMNAGATAPVWVS